MHVKQIANTKSMFASIEADRNRYQRSKETYARVFTERSIVKRCGPFTAQFCHFLLFNGKKYFLKKKRKKIDLKDVTFTATRRIEAPLISTHLYRETKTQEFKVRFTRLTIKSN